LEIKRYDGPLFGNTVKNIFNLFLSTDDKSVWCVPT